MTAPAGQDPRESRVNRFRDRYGRALEVLVGALMVGMAAEVTLGVVFRSIGHSLIWYDEVASVLMAWITYYGAALAALRKNSSLTSR